MVNRCFVVSGDAFVYSACIFFCMGALSFPTFAVRNCNTRRKNPD